MYGPQPFMFKVMSIFVNMDKMLGMSNLKAIAAEGKAVAATNEGKEHMSKINAVSEF